jgi:hypothetical protein
MAVIQNPCGKKQNKCTLVVCLNIMFYKLKGMKVFVRGENFLILRRNITKRETESSLSETLK